MVKNEGFVSGNESGDEGGSRISSLGGDVTIANTGPHQNWTAIQGATQV